MSHWIGPFLVMAFCLSQALRDVYFGNIFQGIDFFLVILLTFSFSSAVFCVITWLRTPDQFAKLAVEWRTLLATKITTTMAWSSYFFALTYLEPSVVNTLHSGMGPITVALLAAVGSSLAGKAPNRAEKISYVGIALFMVALWVIEIGGWSGLSQTPLQDRVLGLVLLLVSGASITVSLLFTKRLHDRGINAEAVTATRYWLIAIFAGVMVWLRPEASTMALTPNFLTWITLIGSALIILPTYILQIGIARTTPMTAHIIRALGPVFVFGLEQLDGRMHYSAPVLICILGYSICVIGGNVANGWVKKRQVAAAH